MATKPKQSSSSLMRIHERLYATHVPEDQDDGEEEPIGAVRVELGRPHRPDGSAEDREVWKVYQLRDLKPEEEERYTARRMSADEEAKTPGSTWSGKFKEGELTVDCVWDVVSVHDTEQEALAAGEKLAGQAR